MLARLERFQWLVLAVAVISIGAIVVAPRFLADERAALELRANSTPPEGAPIRVHVTGAVLRPGVYALRQGDRVIDALTVAGGPSGDADTDDLNLARRARDEEQIVVPKRDGTSSTTTAPALLLAPGTLVDINTATTQQLDQLPGIGEAYSRRIVDSRAVDGRFASGEDLVTRKILPRATYERIRDLITAGP